MSATAPVQGRPGPFAAARRSAIEVAQRLGGGFDVAVVLGSGLGLFANELTDPIRVPAAAVGFAVSSVPGHAGELVAGTLTGGDGASVSVLALSGRVHLYEGNEASTVCHPVRTFAQAGIRRLVLTNAAGGIGPYSVGEVVAVADHLNCTGHNPLVGHLDDPRSRFVDLSDCYAPSRRLADLAGLATGVYAQMLGPSYETPAEIDALQAMGATLAGMSTAIEAIAARHVGMEVCALSLVTNLAAGRGGELSHEEVAREAHQAAARFTSLVSQACLDQRVWAPTP